LVNNQANIREVDAIIHVIRCFENENVVHVDGKVDPVSDKEVIDYELQLKDLESVEKKVAKTEKIAKSGDKDAKKVYEALLIYKNWLEEGKNTRQLEVNREQKDAVKDLYLLTEKPVIYVANVDEDALDGNKYVTALRDSIKVKNAQVIIISASIEAQIAELVDEAERVMFLEEYNLKESGLDQLIRSSYEILDLITYFTTGPKEVRAWTIKKGWRAPQAAGVIHTDFEKGFIKAEVIKYENFKHYGSELACKEAGRVSIEGKDYVVNDGDLIHFRFNV